MSESDYSLTKPTQVGIDMDRSIRHRITTICLQEQTGLARISKMDANIRLLGGYRWNPHDDRHRILTLAVELITIRCKASPRPLPRPKELSGRNLPSCLDWAEEWHVHHQYRTVRQLLLRPAHYNISSPLLSPSISLRLSRQSMARLLSKNSCAARLLQSFCLSLWRQPHTKSV